MYFDQLLSRSAVVEAKVASLLALSPANNSSRLVAVRAVASVGFEHAQSLKHLVAAGLYTSAAALLRMQYESLVRAIWVLYVATEKQAELLLADLTRETAKKANNIPMVSQMLAEIEQKAPHAPINQLKEFKHYSWRPLSSFVHGGIHAVHRHGKGFPVELVRAAILHSNGLLALTGGLLQVIAGVPPEAGILKSIHAEFQDCFPPEAAKQEPASSPSA